MPREMNPEIARLMGEGLKYAAAKKKVQRMSRNDVVGHEPGQTDVQKPPIVPIRVPKRPADVPVRIAGRGWLPDSLQGSDVTPKRDGLAEMADRLEALERRVTELENDRSPAKSGTREAGSSGGKSQFSIANTGKVLPRRVE